MKLREMIASLEASMRPRSAQSSCTSRIRGSGTGCAIGWRAGSKVMPPAEMQIAMLRSLLESEAFENFLAHPVRGAKALFAPGRRVAHGVLDTILHKCPDDGIEEI